MAAPAPSVEANKPLGYKDDGEIFPRFIVLPFFFAVGKEKTKVEKDSKNLGGMLLLNKGDNGMEGKGWCLKCGTRNEGSIDFCQRCGARLRRPKVTRKELKKTLRLSSSEPLVTEETLARQLSVPKNLPLDTIICADCLEVLPRFPAESIDLVVTSPPYNFGLDDYDRHQDTRNWENYFTQLGQVFTECYRVLKLGGRIGVVVQPLFSDYVPTHHKVARLLEEAGFLFQAEIVWEKRNWNCKYTAWGSWKSPSQPYFKYTWEFIEVFAKGSRRKPGSKEAIDITGEEFKKWVYAKWEIAPESRMKAFGHPAMFPEEIPERLVKLFSYRGDIVLDPFNGVGTTTLVAFRLGRHYIGIDISGRYCQIAQARLDEEVKRRSQLPLL